MFQISFSLISPVADLAGWFLHGEILLFGAGYGSIRPAAQQWSLWFYGECRPFTAFSNAKDRPRLMQITITASL